MRKGCLPSRAIYDPLAPVDPAKLQKLKAYLTGPESKHYYKTYGFDDVLFYSVIIAERKDWPDEKHGWLGDDHIAAYVKVLTTRLLRDPTPYYSERVMILDPWFTSMWSRDYAQWKMKPKRVSFKGSTYETWVNGTGGEDPTNKKWIPDVDHLYTILQTGGNHWVTIHVDLPRGHVDCYDCIVGCHTKESDGKILEHCRPFTRMIPQIMSEIIPPEVRVPQYDQFSFQRRDLKKVPQNTITGDCGVYTLKILECLLLGVSFEGITDSNIQGLRVRMATEIYDELPNRMPIRFYET
ncbi:putative Ulp1 protease family catalytic domain, papain-like cysteine peptidase superfamily [Arabidopsis thaliana]